jgi:hypothetical protein
MRRGGLRLPVAASGENRQLSDRDAAAHRLDTVKLEMLLQATQTEADQHDSHGAAPDVDHLSMLPNNAMSSPRLPPRTIAPYCASFAHMPTALQDLRKEEDGFGDNQPLGNIPS